MGSLEEIFQSVDLIHDFNLPYQVGTQGDDPRKAHCESHVLHPGDLIILATDGLWDNIVPDEMKRIIEFCMKANAETTSSLLNEIAKTLATAARRNSVDE